MSASAFFDGFVIAARSIAIIAIIVSAGLYALRFRPPVGRTLALAWAGFGALFVVFAPGHRPDDVQLFDYVIFTIMSATIARKILGMRNS